jgi:hypothetical protein
MPKATRNGSTIAAIGEIVEALLVANHPRQGAPGLVEAGVRHFAGGPGRAYIAISRLDAAGHSHGARSYGSQFLGPPEEDVERSDDSTSI